MRFFVENCQICANALKNANNCSFIPYRRDRPIRHVQQCNLLLPINVLVLLYVTHKVPLNPTFMRSFAAQNLSHYQFRSNKLTYFEALICPRKRALLCKIGAIVSKVGNMENTADRLRYANFD